MVPRRLPENPQCLGVIQNQEPTECPRGFEISGNRCWLSAIRTKAVGTYHGSQAPEDVSLQVPTQTFGIVMTKRLYSDGARGRPLCPPTHDGIRAFIQINRQPFASQDSEKIPKQVQR